MLQIVFYLITTFLIGLKPVQLFSSPEKLLQRWRVGSQQKSAATNPLEESFAGLMLSITLDWAVDIDPVLEDFPMKLTTVREYAQSVAG